MAQREKQRSSVIWNYFRRLPNGKVQCDLCNNTLAFKGVATSNLNRHLRGKHPTTILGMKDSWAQLEQAVGQFVDVNQTVTSDVKNQQSWVQEEDNVESSEDMCQFVNTSTNVKEQSDYEQDPMELDQEEASLEAKIKGDSTSVNHSDVVRRGRHSVSAMWAYFTKISDDKVRCDLCSSEFSFKGSSTSNFIRHIRLKHPTLDLDEKPAKVVIVYEEGGPLESVRQALNSNEKAQAEYEGETLDEVTVQQSESPNEKEGTRIVYRRTSQRSVVWDYFTRIANDKVKCELCNGVLSYKGISMSNLNRHIRAKHTSVNLPVSRTRSRPEHEEEALENEQVITESKQRLAYEYEQLGEEILAHTTEENNTVSFYNKPRRERHNVSVTWDYFIRLGNEKVKCNLCNKVLSYKRSSTSNLNRHMRLKHLDRNAWVYDESEQMEDVQQVLEVVPDADNHSTNDPEPLNSTFSCANGQNPDNQNHSKLYRYVSANKRKIIDEQLLLMIVKGYHPFNIVESVEFQNLVKLLNPNYELPSKKTLSNNLLSMFYNKTLEMVKTNVQNASHVCVTTDNWTSIINENYMAVTIHFIDICCSLKSYTISCFSFTNGDVSDTISKEMTNLLGENKVVACITDNSVDVVRAVQKCGWSHIPCFARTLNEIVQTSIEEIKETRLKASSIVEHFKRNAQCTEVLVNTQTEMGHPLISLKQELGSHWNTTYDMFERLLKTREPLLSTIAITNSDLPELSSEDWEIIQKSCDILKCFHEVTVELQNERYVIISKVALLMKALTNICKQAKDKAYENPKLNAMIEVMNEQLTLKFQAYESVNVMWEATFLDPRFKKYGFPTESKFHEIKEEIVNEVSEVKQIDHYELLASSESTKTTDNSSSIWQDFDSNVVHLVQTENSRATSIIEVEKYLDQPLLSRHENPLKWWKENKVLYPRLFHLVKRKFCLVATCVPSARDFSKEGRAMTEKRSVLTGSKVSKVVFLNSNLS